MSDLLFISILFLFFLTTCSLLVVFNRLMEK